MELRAILERLRQLAEDGGRPDLVARVDSTLMRLDAPNTRVLVVGEFKQGKSLLVNALVNAPVCPVDDDVATAVPTVVSYGARPTVSEVFADVDRGTPSESRRAVAVAARLPVDLLQRGLVLVDTPGVGGIGTTEAAGTIAELLTADAVLMISDASQEYSEPELEFLREALKLCPNILCLLTKTDLYPHWRRVLDVDQALLGEAGLAVPMLAVSSTLRIQALRTRDVRLHDESGFPALVSYLRHEILDNAEQLSRRSAAHDVRHVTDHLALSLHSELTVLDEADRDRALIADLEAARAQVEALKRSSSRWQATLNDGMVDLHADVEYDIRDRTRLIIRDAEEIVEAADPAQIADQFDQWLRQRAAEAVAANFVWAYERAQWLATEVADRFAQVEVALPDLRAPVTERVLDPVPHLPPSQRDRTSFVGKVLIGMRGSYGGVLMFGLLTGLAGMALINPLSVGAGVLLGKRAYNEDRAGRLGKRRAETKFAVRRVIDDVVLHVTKQAKDRLRETQRYLRDYFLTRAPELTRSMNDSITAARAAIETSGEVREQRAAVVRAALAELADLQLRAQLLADQGTDRGNGD